MIITSMVITTPRAAPGPYVGGETITLRVTFNNTGGTSAFVDATLDDGSYSGLAFSGPAGVMVTAGGTSTQVFSIVIMAGATTAAVTLTATWTGTEMISGRAISGGGNNIVVNIQRQAIIAITGIVITTPRAAPGPYVSGETMSLIVTFNNTGGTNATVDATIDDGAYAGLGLTDNPVAVVVAAGGTNTQVFSVPILVSATTTVGVTITTLWTGTEAISGRAINGDVLADTVIVNVNSVAPVITQPADITYEYSLMGHSISWTITDNSRNITSFTIFHNGVVNFTDTWVNGSVITQVVDGLNLGVYNYTIVALDGLGYIAQDTVIVTVNNPAPVVTQPAGIAYEYSRPGHAITWTITDNSTSTTSYSILRNGSSIATGTWMNGSIISRGVDGLNVSTYNFTIIATDGVGGITQRSVVVTVYNLAPGISHPANVSYEYKVTGNAISWNVTDNSIFNASWNLYRNALLVGTGTWANGSLVTTSIDGLAIGSYIFTFIVADGLSGSISDVVAVTVFNRPPSLSITNGPELEILHMSFGNRLQFMVSDNSTMTQIYVIYRNDTQIAQGAWISGQMIDISIDGLERGEYNYRITIQDGLGGTASLSIVVIVQFNTPLLVVFIAGFIVGLAIIVKTGTAANHRRLRRGIDASLLDNSIMVLSSEKINKILRNAKAGETFKAIVERQSINGEFIMNGAYFVKRACINAFKEQLAEHVHVSERELKGTTNEAKDVNVIQVNVLLGDKIDGIFNH